MCGIIPLIEISTKIPISFFISNQYFFILINVSILYGIYPALNKTEKFYRKRGYVNVVLEYEFVKKFLFVTVCSDVFTNITLFSSSISAHTGDDMWKSIRGEG